MTFEIATLTIILIGAVVLFALDIFPVDKVSILILAALVLTRQVTPREAVSGFGNTATITVACMLALSYGIQQTGALNYVANKIVDLVSGSHLKTLVSVILAVGILSAFINNTAAVALFLPLTLAVSREQNLDPAKLLMPMSFAAMFAGMCTLIGTSTNLLVYALALEWLNWRIGMFEFAVVGLIFFLAGTLYLLLLGHRLIPSRRMRRDLTEDYRLRHFVTELVLLPNSPLLGRTVSETRLGEMYDLEILELIRDRQRFLPSAEEVQLQSNDILLVKGDPQTLMRIGKQQGLTIKAMSLSDRDLQDDNIMLVEAFVSPSSRLIESTIKEINFRKTYKATALAIRSHGRTIREKVGRVRLEFGDSLLILTTREQLHALRESPDFLVLEEVRMTLVRKDKVYWAVGIFLAMIFVATAGILNIMEAAIVAVSLMILTGCFRLRNLYQNFSWQVIVMLGCLIPLGAAMENSGLAALVADTMVHHLSAWGPVAVLSGLYLLTTLLTSVMSNNATAVLLVPIAVTIARQLNVDPKPLVIAVMFAASASFLTPIGYQTNTFIFAPGGYRFSDFVRVGAPLTLIFWIMATWLIPWYWPF